jgi:hypothetical protein
MDCRCKRFKFKIFGRFLNFFQYLVDVVDKRIPIHVLKEEVSQYSKGEHVHTLQVGSIDVSNLPDHDVLNVSVLEIRLLSQDKKQQLCEVKIVTRPYRKEDDNKIYRAMYNPL